MSMTNPHTLRSTTVDDDPLPVLVSIKGIAEHLGVSVRHVRRLVAERRIPFIKWGHLLRFDPVEVSAWLETQRLAATAPPVRPPY